MNPYETDQYLNEYLLFHYGTPRDKSPFAFAPRDALRFHERIIPECVRPLRFAGPTRGLDVGCAVGRLTFELAGVVDEAVGVDNARALIGAARRLARHGQVQIQRRELRDELTPLTIKLPARFRKRQVRFRVGDAQDLPRRAYHVVLGINLLCRLPDPRKFLRQAPALVVPGGQLVLGSPHTWLTDYTPRRRWLTQADVREILAADFRLVRQTDLPFLIRETQRKYQWNVSQLTTFIRRAIS